jgi:hypothetical protein
LLNGLGSKIPRLFTRMSMSEISAPPNRIPRRCPGLQAIPSFSRGHFLGRLSHARLYTSWQPVYNDLRALASPGLCNSQSFFRRLNPSPGGPSVRGPSRLNSVSFLNEPARHHALFRSRFINPLSLRACFAPSDKRSTTAPVYQALSGGLFGDAPFF